MKFKKVLLSVLTFSLLSSSQATAQDEVSGVYIGGHIRRERPTTITKLRESGFTYALLFNVHVEKDGTLTTDGETICKDGVYVFANQQPYYQQDIKNLKTAPTSIKRIDIVIGGWGNTSYANIKSLIEANGTGSNTMLYKNFKALKEAVPEIDAVNNDDEHCYDLNTGSKFHIMMYDLGYLTTLAPYMNKSYWQQLCNQIQKSRPKAVDRVMIQCYDGGAYNNPSDWTFSGVTNRHAGRTNYQTDMNTSIKQMETWYNNKAAVGGFVWVYNDETWNLNAWASAMNRTFRSVTVPEEETVVKVYSEYDNKGYCINLKEGTYTKADLAVMGLAGNDMSSFEIVQSGYSIKLYRSVGCTGIFLKRSTSLARLPSTYNNQVNSIKIEPIETGINNLPREDQEEVHTKFMEHNKLFILKGGKKYNIAGQRVE